MKKKHKKTRSIASYRAASLKGARTRKQMKRVTESQFWEIVESYEPKRRTIDLVPKVKWP